MTLQSTLKGRTRNRMDRESMKTSSRRERKSLRLYSTSWKLSVRELVLGYIALRHYMCLLILCSVCRIALIPSLFVVTNSLKLV